MKFLFIVQGEGRGHMTQAISLFDILNKNNHEVCAVIVGKSKRRELPHYVKNGITSPIYHLESPNFVLDKKNKSVNISSTVLYNLKRSKIYLNSLKKIDQVVKQHKPDVIINFYDLLAGLYNMFYKPQVKYYVIGHQYLMFHPDFKFPAGHFPDRLTLSLNTWATQYGSKKKLALSFKSMRSTKDILVIPPLLRKEIFNYIPSKGDYFVAYVVNDGYGNDIITWHKKNTNYKLHLFWDNKSLPDEFSPHENLVIHHLNDKKFHNLLLNCSGFISTAGFESLCEAHYYDKPVIMVPVEGQFEQLCNAVDATNSGIGIHSDSFDITPHLSSFVNANINYNGFQKWVESAEEAVLRELSLNEVKNIKYQYS